MFGKSRQSFAIFVIGYLGILEQPVSQARPKSNVLSNRKKLAQHSSIPSQFNGYFGISLNTGMNIHQELVYCLATEVRLLLACIL